MHERQTNIRAAICIIVVQGGDYDEDDKTLSKFGISMCNLVTRCREQNVELSDWKMTFNEKRG